MQNSHAKICIFNVKVRSIPFFGALCQYYQLSYSSKLASYILKGCMVHGVSFLSNPINLPICQWFTHSKSTKIYVNKATKKILRKKKGFRDGLVCNSPPLKQF